MDNKFAAALDRLHKFRDFCCENHVPGWFSSMHETVMEALEKQAPKMASVVRAGTGGYAMIYGVCPVCRCAELHPGDRFCLYCGQAVEWKED